jgi:hypothetical protein
MRNSRSCAQVASGTIISPVIETVESIAESAAPAVKFLTGIPALFHSSEPSAESSEAQSPLVFGPSRNFGFVVPEMCVVAQDVLRMR